MEETKEILETKKIKREKIKNIVKEVVFCFLYCFILYFGTYIVREGNCKPIEIIYNMVLIFYHRDIIYFILPNLILITTFMIIKSLLRDNLKTYMLLTVLTLIITTISCYKFNVLEEPFLPVDILLAGNAGEIAGYGLTFFPISILILTAILIFVLIRYAQKRKLDYKMTKRNLKTEFYRIPMFLIGSLVIYLTCISPSRFEIMKIPNGPEDNYRLMGANATFFTRLGDFYFPKPSGYKEEAIQTIKNKVEEKTMDEVIEKEKPNVIFIMNESFTDPKKIKNVEYSVNPLENIEKLSKEDKNCVVGNTVTAVFGGGTSIPEFEALTGLSSYFVEKQIYPYTSYITSDMNSVVREYANSGYTTFGLHTNTKTFYNRYKVYKYLGFENTIFEEDIENPESGFGGVIQDSEIAKQIIKIFEENKEKKFVFGVTMQNHMPYDKKKYDDFDIDVRSDVLSEDEKYKLRNYVQGVYDGDKMYHKLVEYLKTIDEPTILVMFGDHLPALVSIYTQSEYTMLDNFTTPYVVWANYNIDYTEYLDDYMSPSNLSLSLMKMANVDIPWYLQEFEMLYKKFPVFNNVLTISDDYILKSKSLVEKDELIHDCELLQYDLLIKKKYIPVR